METSTINLIAFAAHSDPLGSPRESHCFCSMTHIDPSPIVHPFPSF